MIPIAQYLPKAYIHPQTTVAKREIPLDGPGSRPAAKPEKIIEAEWRPFSSPVVAPSGLLRASHGEFSTQEEALAGGVAPAAAAERYRQMTQNPVAQSGTRIDTRA